MTREAILAQMKAAAWAAVAQLGANEAARMLAEVKAEVERSQWSDRNGGDR